MKVAEFVRSRLGWKLLWSHLVIVLVGSSVLGVVAYYHAPTAFTHHILRMEVEVGTNPALEADLRGNFLAAIGEILIVSGIAAALAALLVSSFVAWRIVGPVRSLTAAGKRIAGGDYRERVHVVWNDELAELAHSFNSMATAVDATEQRRVELIGNLAHELKTPLTIIRSMMEGLVDGVLPADATTFLDVQRETYRLQRLTDEMRELSAAEAGAIPLVMKPTDPDGLVRQATSRLQPQFADKGVELRTEVADRLPQIMADRERVLQIFINLLGNALRYTDSGGLVVVRVQTTNAATRQMVQFDVSDTGIGIAREDLTRIFERFYRVEKSRSRTRGGSGIGLTIAAHLVRAQGGTITAHSAGPGQGSTFAFSLPCVAE